ncbi:MAG: efflux RND transporter periplasmic adaptor subunit [Paludibacter sp.]|nr:efflux RND transporter periplasmic adaptor subunit [Paludibacter sp.]
MKQFKLFGIAIVALALSFSSCKKQDSASAGQNAGTPAVRIEPAVEKEVEQIYEVTATIQPEVKNSIAPTMPGRIRNIFVEVGQHVSKGQKLVQMDNINLSNLETQLVNIRETYRRVSELFAVGGSSQQELDNARMQLNVAETNLKNLQENTYLLSPINGVVTARGYDNGDLFNGQIPVLTVMTINPVKVVVNISESYYSQVKTGMPAEIKFDVLEGQTFTGRVNLIYPTIDERSRTFAVEIKLANNSNKIRPGMFARVTMEFGKAKHVLVPDKAIVKQIGAGTRYVYVYSDGKVQYKEVEVGRRIDTSYEILSGLSAGEQVVVAGQIKLADGVSVNVIK